MIKIFARRIVSVSPRDSNGPSPEAVSVRRIRCLDKPLGLGVEREVGEGYEWGGLSRRCARLPLPVPAAGQSARSGT